jgi:mRNA-degrading endonuclease YafQ of YafQ-DinJ toxin-antitoxin module
MMFEVYTTPRFERNLRKFVRKHPELRAEIERAFSDLAEDPFQPRLRMHPLRGQLAGFHAVRIDYANRIVLVLNVDEQEITLAAIGSHDEAYR